ncbi:pseudouridine synthase [Bacillus sp. J14TS2]|uniref:RluA family pseudouridine synthase n=1 Tax=Bacillus sp. J14TS2 TaxID=2807188 RepID=UPI001B014A59|nr:RluA family pseudouridine synthase [Bacillus sp. J14TS2]GIN73820.1 pseudouridine synthase [Bacillus sp. J14TS2]
MLDQPIRISVHEKWDGITPQTLFKDIWQTSKKQLHQWRMEKIVFKNDELVNWVEPLQSEDILKIKVNHEKETSLQPHSIPCEILYEDNHLFIVNKPAGLAVHPNHNEGNTLANRVAAYLQSKNDHRKVRHIHRLDQDTSGAILYAKHALSHTILDKMLENRTIQRTYWALTDGIFTGKGHVDKPIGRDRHHPTRRRVSKTGKAATTNYEVLDCFPQEQLTLVQCSLATGRTHQIRVHMQSLGYPLAGDLLYGGSPRFSRQALHARYLEFTHPFTLEKIKVTAPFLDVPPIFDFTHYGDI